MTEFELVTLWTTARWHIIMSQIAPTFLLTLAVFVSTGLAETGSAVRIAAAGILLASGILGAAAQIAASNEGLAVIRDLRSLGSTGAVTGSIIAAAPWVNLVRYVAPAIFVVVYVALLWALFIPVQ